MTETQKIYDVVLIGGGIMSATLGTLISKLEPSWSIKLIERLDDVALESSNPWNNAGTGHAALCELNYTPETNAVIDTTKALAINEQYTVSRQFWASLVESGELPDPSAFINDVPHMTFVRGEANVDYLRRRYELLRAEPLFATMEYTEDPAVIFEWAPALMVGRDKTEKVAATRVASGTDVDFGSLTRQLVQGLIDNGAVVRLGTEVAGLRQQRDGVWQVATRVASGPEQGRKNVTRARFVFVGAGGGALPLLQKARIPEIRGYGGFPISGQFYRTDNPDVVAKHHAKVYGKALVGAPPMSVPHLDTRIVDGKPALMFGPYAGFSPKYLKTGSFLDLFRSLRLHNIVPMLAVAKDNFDLVSYLVGQLLATPKKKFTELQSFFPEADPADWRLITAGQRVQVMKRDPKKGGVLQMGTEVVAKADGTIAGLLGASPGASVAVPVMVDLLKKCFPARVDEWTPRLTELVPTYGTRVNDSQEKADEVLAKTGAALRLGKAQRHQ
ncbi:putative malate:quinone oxidoreductase [Pseudoclavibacter endophyticus]|uniref:Probable malate:quinone oxidoreductase n=1 Tax=Pseudoclavibacter endophyticus TaxID=1778590 RepID=A0A6H9WBS9_9MICO|nr:malate:quinone oxidoreductase [Pseudoclavibacter endophyticus]KAB1648123.1 malate:quinone oxidoreductase [Pseudoclavibacter endophyticus]GGA69920.1 putative malate:quinone oxidoreductase [Pseudoclavibacter endophyticus]